MIPALWLYSRTPLLAGSSRAVGLPDIQMVYMYTTLFCGVSEWDKFANCRLGQFGAFF